VCSEQDWHYWLQQVVIGARAVRFDEGEQLIVEVLHESCGDGQGRYDADRPASACR
jgi:hypothetical protein